MDLLLQPVGTDARFFQDNPIAAIDLLDACKTAVAYFPNPIHPARMQLQAAIALVEARHIPRRPIAEVLQREAATVGAGLDAESIEQGEVAA